MPAHNIAVWCNRRQHSGKRKLKQSCTTLKKKFFPNTKIYFISNYGFVFDVFQKKNVFLPHEKSKK